MRLAEELATGQPFTLHLVEKHSRAVAVACGLSPTGADALHNKDIYNLVAQEASTLRTMDKADARRRIFSLIDMH
jgi:hypothetical protein